LSFHESFPIKNEFLFLVPHFPARGSLFSGSQSMKLSRQNFDEIHPDMKRAETSSFDYKLFNSISEEFKAFSDLISCEKILPPPFETRKNNVEYSPSTILMFPSTFPHPRDFLRRLYASIDDSSVTRQFLSLKQQKEELKENPKKHRTLLPFPLI
jgi:hypothetical protein